MIITIINYIYITIYNYYKLLITVSPRAAHVKDIYFFINIFVKKLYAISISLNYNSNIKKLNQWQIFI